jgi:hypothetical protein
MVTLPFEAMSSAMGVVGSPFEKIAKHFLLRVSVASSPDSSEVGAGGEGFISRGIWE